MTIPAQNQTPDTALRETCNAKAALGTHLATDAASDALFVQRGTGTLGDAQGALDVQPGTGLVGETEHTISSLTSVDIGTGDGNPRRDVVYLNANGSLAVAEGSPAPFAWDEALNEDERTISNAYRPAPPDLADTPALALAVITVPANATTLPTGAISELRAEAPAGTGVATGAVDGQPIQSGLDGRVVAVAPGVGVIDAIDPADTPTPVGDAYALARDAGGGQVILPPEPVENAARIDIDSGVAVNILGTAYRRSRVIFTDTSDHGFVVNSPSNPPVPGSYWHNFQISGADVTARTKGATSALYFNHSPKDFNIGALAFEEWNSSVISGASGSMAYGSTWEHLAFGYGESDNRGTLLELHGQGAPLQIGQFHAATSTTDPLITTDQGRHVYLDIGTLNIGGEHGPVIDISGGSYSILDIGMMNFEPVGDGTASAVYDLAGHVCGRVGPTLAKTGTVDDVFVLGDDHGVFIAGVEKGGNNTINNAVVRVAGPHGEKSPSYYAGYAADIDYGGFSHETVVPLASPEAVPTPTTRTSANYTASYGEIVLCDTSANSVTVTLPTAESGMRVSAQNILSSSGNNMVIEPSDGAAIDGETSLTRGTEGVGNELVCDGTDWWTVS